jgi:hypothetical protein
MRHLLAHLAKRLWPYLRPLVLDLLIAHAERREATKQDAIARRADQRARRYIGE